MSPEPVRVLILSGANNHDWKITTPALREIVAGCPRLRLAGVLEDPSKLDAGLLAGCDVILNNWCAFPALTGRQWGAAAEAAFLAWIGAGQGLVTIHAGCATLQDWPEFQRLVGLTWGMDRTGHSAWHAFRVGIADREHPITRGLGAFWIEDELWHRMAALAPAPDQRVLAEAWSDPANGGSGAVEPVLLETRLGKGRGLNLVLGHDVRPMGSPAFQTLLLRGLEWAATGEATVPAAHGWPSTAEAASGQAIVPDGAIRAAAAWRQGLARKDIFILEEAARRAVTAEARKALAAKVAAALAGATPDARDVLLRVLSVVGSAAEVPAAAAFLADARSSHMARYALERLPGPEAAAALRKALGEMEGALRTGIANSLESLSRRAKGS